MHCRPALFLAAGILLAARGGWAGPLEEVKTASGLANIDAQALKKGEVIGARGTKGSFPHGVYVESCFFVRRPLAAVGNALLQWDPSKHPEDEVAAYALFRAPAEPDLLRIARLNPEHRPDRWMLEQSAAIKTGKGYELHLGAADEAMLRRETGGASAAWERVLRARAEAVAAGGLAASPAYSAAGAKINAQAELRGLLGMTPQIAAKFSDVTAGGDRSLYAERSLTQGHTSFSLGTLTAQQSAETWQVMDCTYYTSDTYFMSVDLYYLWAWEGGTLVWQIDYVSAPFRALTAGLDKVFAGREILKEAASSIETFRHSAEQ